MSESTSRKNLSEQQFEDKLNQIVKIIKLKEQICLEIIEHLQLVLVNSAQLSTQMFLHDEMSKHKFFLDKMNKKNFQCKTSEKSVHFFNSETYQLTEVERSLVRRVSARVLELFQSFNQKVEKYFHFEKETSFHYRLIKPKFLKQINIIDRNGSAMSSIFQLCTMFFSYLESKFNDQCKKLNKIIELIQNGQIHQIQSAFICEHCKEFEKKPVAKEACKSPKNLSSSKNLQIKQSQEREMKYFSKEKEKITQKIKALRHEAKTKQTIKKQRTKFASKYYTLYQSAMDIHKGHLMDELTFLDEKQHKEKILSDMESRNRYNLSFIKGYITCCEEKNMIEKTNYRPDLQTVKPQETENYEEQEQISPYYRPVRIFDKVIERDACNISLQYPIGQKNQPEIMIKDLKEAPKSHTIGIQIEEKSEVKSFRITNPNKKSAIPTPKSNPNLFSIKEIGTISQSFNFVKINMKNGHHQRARLPDISNRMFSVDQKHKSAKIIDRPDNQIGSNNLLILKTCINRPTKDSKKEKKNKVEQNNRIQTVMIKNSDKIEKKVAEVSINPISRNKKVMRSESGNKFILENNQKVSLKSLEINYSTSISKKVRNFCEVVSTKDLNL